MAKVISASSATKRGFFIFQRGIRMGRPRHKPTAKQKADVSEMVAMGTPHEQIAIKIGISAKTLRRRYEQEIKASAIDANLSVAKTLFQMATSGQCAAATIFWCKVRNGFRVPGPEPTPQPEKQQQQQVVSPPIKVINNDDGGPLS